MKEPRVVESIANECQSLGRAHESSSARAEQLIACLEGEIVKRDEELAACRVAVENCEAFRARIAEIEADRDSHQRCAIQAMAELSALKAQEPVAYISGCYRDVIGGKSDRTPLGAELAFVNMGWIGQIPLYAAPVSEAKAQGVVMPTVDQAMRVVLREMGSSKHIRGTSNWCADVGRAVLDEVARLNAAPAAPAADAWLVEALDYQVLFDAIAAATSVYANGAINISVQAFRESLAAHRAKGVV